MPGYRKNQNVIEFTDGTALSVITDGWGANYGMLEICFIDPAGTLDEPAGFLNATDVWEAIFSHANNMEATCHKN
jgi:hypothetical protein